MTDLDRSPTLWAPDVETQAIVLVEGSVDIVVDGAEGEMLFAAGSLLGESDEVEELEFGEALGDHIEEMAETPGIKLVPILAGDFQFRHGGATLPPYLSSSL